MAYLTQYSNSVPVIKYHIDQLIMTMGQNFDMDICIPEDGVADNHAELEVVKSMDTYQFIVKSNENASLIELNGAAIKQAELQDGDWLVIGGVEFQFTDDGVNSFSEEPVSTIPEESVITIPEESVITIHEYVDVTLEPNIESVMEFAPIMESVIEFAPIMEAKVERKSEALDLLKELKDDLQNNDLPLTTKEFIENSRNSRRRLAF